MLTDRVRRGVSDNDVVARERNGNGLVSLAQGPSHHCRHRLNGGDALSAEAPKLSATSETFKVMERRLLKAIINPSMIVVFVTGFLLAYITGYWRDPWLQMKFALVLGLAALHGYFARQVKIFAKDENRRSSRFFRILNEVPTVLMVLIVILVVIKPF